MNKSDKLKKNAKRIISLLMVIFQMKLIGGVSNTFNARSVKNYHKIVESFADFLQREGIDDVQHIYEYYNYAMWNGYFSDNHKLKYTTDRQVYIDNAGMSIMSGTGVCLNYADMLSLIFKKMGFKSYVTMCYVDSNSVKVDRIRTDKEIVRNIENETNNITNSNILKSISKIIGNHAVTCVEYDNKLYFFDPTNLAYLNKTGINDLSIINGEGNFDLKYLSSFFFENINVLKVLMSVNEQEDGNEIFKKEEIDFNVDGLEEFYNSCREYIENTVSNNGQSKSIVLMLFYSTIASFIMILAINILERIAKKLKVNDARNLLPELKKYFDEKNIKTEFELLKNYEFVARRLGTNDNIFKTLIRKSIDILGDLFTDKKFHSYMLMLCLNNLGYNATINNAKRYNGKIGKKEVPLIIYFDEDDAYVYDNDIGELLYKENDMFYSADGKYRYKLASSRKYEDMSKDFIQEKMNNENITLAKEDVKYLRKRKVLRK